MWRPAGPGGCSSLGLGEPLALAGGLGDALSQMFQAPQTGAPWLGWNLGITAGSWWLFWVLPLKSKGVLSLHKKAPALFKSSLTLCTFLKVCLN